MAGKDAAPSVSAPDPHAEKAAYPMPSLALPAPLGSKGVASPAPSAAKEYVVAPQRGTLAAGRWEAKPATIWIAVAMAALILLGWALFRVRRAQVAKRRKAEALVAIRRA